jgi:hypothetical protein
LPASGVALGAVCLAVLAAPTTPVTRRVRAGRDFSDGEFIAYKTSFAVALGALVTPVIALRAIADRVAEPAAPDG